MPSHHQITGNKTKNSCSRHPSNAATIGCLENNYSGKETCIFARVDRFRQNVFSLSFPLFKLFSTVANAASIMCAGNSQVTVLTSDFNDSATLTFTVWEQPIPRRTISQSDDSLSLAITST
jgi:hypothetical protein